MIISKCRIIDTDLYWQSPKRQQILWILTKTQWNSVFLRIEQKYNEIQFFLCILTNKNTMRFSVLWKNDFSMKFIACNGRKYIVIYTDRVAECSRSARCNFRMQHAATFSQYCFPIEFIATGGFYSIGQLLASVGIFQIKAKNYEE